jgi:hypothetical protein
MAPARVRSGRQHLPMLPKCCANVQLASQRCVEYIFLAAGNCGETARPTCILRAEGPAVHQAQGIALGNGPHQSNIRPNGPTVLGAPRRTIGPLGRHASVVWCPAFPGRCPGLGELQPLRGVLLGTVVQLQLTTVGRSFTPSRNRRSNAPSYRKMRCRRISVWREMLPKMRGFPATSRRWRSQTCSKGRRRGGRPCGGFPGRLRS